MADAVTLTTPTLRNLVAAQLAVALIQTRNVTSAEAAVEIFREVHAELKRPIETNS